MPDLAEWKSPSKKMITETAFAASAALASAVEVAIKKNDYWNSEVNSSAEGLSSVEVAIKKNDYWNKISRFKADPFPRGSRHQKKWLLKPQ